jgi:hypothetical protein
VRFLNEENASFYKYLPVATGPRGRVLYAEWTLAVVRRSGGFAAAER